MMKQIALSLILVAFSALFVDAQSSLKDGKIPKDLVITLDLSSTAQFSEEYIYRITADGKVYFEDYSNLLPAQPGFAGALQTTPGKTKWKKPKTAKLKDRLSKKQIRRLVLAFENSGFFAMNDAYTGDPSKEYGCVNHADTKKLTISLNGKTKTTAFTLGCNYGEYAPLESFLALYDKVDEELRGVKKIKVQPALNSGTKR